MATTTMLLVTRAHTHNGRRVLLATRHEMARVRPKRDLIHFALDFTAHSRASSLQAWAAGTSGHLGQGRRGDNGGNSAAAAQRPCDGSSGGLRAHGRQVSWMLMARDEQMTTTGQLLTPCPSSLASHLIADQTRPAQPQLQT